MAVVPFILMSIIGRGARFFLVAGIMYWGGEKMEHKLRHYIEYIGWLVIVAVVILYFFIKH